MKSRKLRIAWSVLWSLAALSLVAFWVRSYWQQDTLAANSSGSGWYGVTISREGRLTLSVARPYLAHPSFGYWVSPVSELKRAEASLKDSAFWTSELKRRFEFKIFKQGGLEARSPHWAVLLVLGALGVAPWLPWSPRFSLRTLLIATTIVSAFLGLFVWTAT